MKANADVTDALRRTIGLMQSELERSVLSVQMLGMPISSPFYLCGITSRLFIDSSTSTLRSTSSTQDTLTSVLGTSKQLVTALEKSDWLDRVLILSAFAFFVLVVLFIAKQRIVDKGLRIAFWWTRFLPDFTGDEALLADGKDLEKGTATFEVAKSSASSASAIITSMVSAAASLVASASLSSRPFTPATEGDDDKARSLIDEPDLEITFTQSTSPTSSVAKSEPTRPDDMQATAPTNHVIDEL